MSMRLSDFKRKLLSIKSSGGTRLRIIVNKQRDDIEEKNRESLRQGKLKDSSDIINRRSSPTESTYLTNRYSKLWKPFREAKGRQTKFVDLGYTFQFYKSIKYKKTEDGGKIITTDPDKKKVDDIMDRYTEGVLGLQEHQLQEIADESAQMLADEIISKLTT